MINKGATPHLVSFRNSSRKLKVKFPEVCSRYVKICMLHKDVYVILLSYHSNCLNKVQLLMSNPELWREQTNKDASHLNCNMRVVLWKVVIVSGNQGHLMGNLVFLVKDLKVQNNMLWSSTCKTTVKILQGHTGRRVCRQKVTPKVNLWGVSPQTNDTF